MVCRRPVENVSTKIDEAVCKDEERSADMPAVRSPMISKCYIFPRAWREVRWVAADDSNVPTLSSVVKLLGGRSGERRCCVWILQENQFTTSLGEIVALRNCDMDPQTPTACENPGTLLCSRRLLCNHAISQYFSTFEFDCTHFLSFLVESVHHKLRERTLTFSVTCGAASGIFLIWETFDLFDSRWVFQFKIRESEHYLCRWAINSC